MRTKSSCSDKRLPIGYLLRNFQQNWRNFLDHSPPPPPPPTIKLTGVDPFGSAPLLLECRRPGRKGVDTGGIGCSKPIGIMIHIKSSRSDDCQPISYMLLNLQPIWTTLCVWSLCSWTNIFQLQIAVNPYEFWRSRYPRVAMIAYPYDICSPIFSQIEATFVLPTAAIFKLQIALNPYEFWLNKFS